jgi:hypothetical protein
MTKYRGYRALLSRNTTGSTYATVGQILETGDAGSTRELIDVTAHGDEWMDFLGSRQEGTEFTLRLAFDPADTQHAALKADYDAGTSKKFHVVHPDITGSTAAVEFTAITTGFLIRDPMDGAHEAELTLKIVNPGVAFVANP